MLQKAQRTGQGRGMLGASLPTFGGTESMTKFPHTTPPPDAAALRKAPSEARSATDLTPSSRRPMIIC
jgi:hypothetical protein